MMSDSHEYYSVVAPSNQAMLDIFKGEWSSRMPAETGLVTSPGQAGLFDDPRIAWAGQMFQGFEGKSVLELGPLEGGHSYMMQQAGASKVIAVEANNRAFLKCLIVKQILNLTNVQFLFGDFNRYLEQEERLFDIVIASGVLYHMTNPVRALNLMSSASRNLMLWTHYFDQKEIEERGLSSFYAPVESRSYAGLNISLAKKSYLEAVKWEGFCGGAHDYAYWLTRDSLLALLKHYGFKRIEIAFDSPDHPNGPALALCAMK
jgi:2-polyprenyl-3-methyl-5-hydroxy-6-metoxy-1,4-benzoquinol methylase